MSYVSKYPPVREGKMQKRCHRPGASVRGGRHSTDSLVYFVGRGIINGLPPQGLRIICDCPSHGTLRPCTTPTVSRRLCGPPCYSKRSAVMGSTLVARTAGIHVAAKAIALSNNGIRTN